MIASGALLAATILAPLGLLFGCLWRWPRRHGLRLLPFAPLPGLAAALLAADAPPLVIDPDQLRLTLELRGPAALLLGAASLLWCAAGAYAARYMAADADRARFVAFWLLTMAGSLGVFVAGDLISFYLLFAFVSLAAYALVAHQADRAARRAGQIYLILAVLGEIGLLLAFALLATASPGQSLAIRDVVAALQDSPWRDATLLLLLAGFGLKAGLAPLHVWLPLAHPAAPMPASAVLSGAIVKAGIVGLMLFLPLGTAQPTAGGVVTALGFVTVFYGVALGITQANPKTVLAYSTMSQMGLVIATLGVALGAGAEAALPRAAFLASHHVLAKGALFLAVGVVMASGPRRLWPVMLPAAVLALGFAGAPLTGGQVAKLVAKDALGAGLPGLLGVLSGATSTLLMVHFLRMLRRVAAGPGAAPPAGLVRPWLTTAAAAILLPWALLPLGGFGRWGEALSAAALWAAAWPVLIGLGLAAALWRLEGRLPAVPPGDVVVLAERAARATAPWMGGLVRLEAALRAWPAAGLSLLLVGLALGAALAWGQR